MHAPAEELDVHLAQPTELPGLGKIWHEMMSFHQRQDERFALALDAQQRWQSLASEMIYRSDGFLLAATLGEHPAGFCLGWVARNPPIYRVSEVGFVSEIAVTAWARRRGIGRALLDTAGQWFRDRGLEEFQLSTAIWNETAQSFWKAAGGSPMLVRYRFEL